MNDHRTRILITIDTEFSIGGHFADKANKPVPAERHIYCKINGIDYGINMIMDILDGHDLKGVFFVESEARFYFGEEEIINIIKNIENRGHEVQLHIHPNYNYFKNGERVPDDLRRFSFDEQKNIIKKALRFFSSYGINDISAFRSGGFYSNLNTIWAIYDNNIKFSSNYNLAFSNCKYIEKEKPQNDIFNIENIFEVPITCYREPRIRKEWNSFQISASSYTEVKKALNYYYNQGTKLITFITHSFEFVKPYDIQYSTIRPHNFLITRFKNICKFLDSNRDKFETINFRDLSRLARDNNSFSNTEGCVFYKSSLKDTISRYLENYYFSRLFNH